MEINEKLNMYFDAKILSCYTKYVDDIFLIYDSTRTKPDLINTPINARTYSMLFSNPKFALKHLKRSYIFRSQPVSRCTAYDTQA